MTGVPKRPLLGPLALGESSDVIEAPTLAPMPLHKG